MSDPQFKVGRCYFLVGYLDQKFQFPFVQSYVFVGKRGAGNGARWLFQDVYSYCKQGQHESSDEASGVEVMALDFKSLETMLSPAALADEFARLGV